MTLQESAENARGDIDTIYVHWSAGHYNQLFNDYHVCITGNGNVFPTTDDLTELKSHTWHRNSRAVGVALCCCAFATSDDLGDPERLKYNTENELNIKQIPYEPPTEAQLKALAQTLYTLCVGLGIPIDKDHVMTHAEIADIDGYGPATTCERWDLAILRNGDVWMSGGEQIRQMAQEAGNEKG